MKTHLPENRENGKAVLLDGDAWRQAEAGEGDLAAAHCHTIRAPAARLVAAVDMRNVMGSRILVPPKDG